MSDRSQSPPSGAGLLIALVAAGTFLGASFGSMVTVALPSIGRSMDVSMDAAGWVVQAFLAIAAITLIPAGRLGDRWGHLRVYRIGLVVLVLASVLCAAAPVFWVLLVGRGLQGLGAGMLMSCGPALLTTSVPPAQRGRVLGVVSTATYTGLTLGPPLAGFLVEALGWQGVFGAGVVLGVVVLVPTLRLRREERRGPPRVDLTTELRMFRSPVFSGTMAAAVLLYSAIFIVTMLFPFYLEEGLLLRPDRVGAILMAQPLVMAMTASPAGWFSDRIGTRGLAAGGMLTCALALGSMGLLFDGGTSLWLVAALLVALGLGCGLFVSPNSSALMGAADVGAQGSAGAMLAIARTVGMFLGISLATGVFSFAGGAPRGRWGAAEFHAFGAALAVGAGIMLVGATISAVRGEPGR
ncbi:MAG: MFS transporter [Pseudomonadota bacterium]